MDPTDSQVAVAVRREIGRQGRRVAIPLVALLLVVGVLATDRDDRPVDTTATGTATSVGFAPSERATATSLSVPGTAAQSTPTDGGGRPSPVPTIRSGASRDSNAVTGLPAAPADARVSRTGVECDGTNRQLPESSYGPLCIPEFRGDNGGATSYGVTADEIVVTYRIATSASGGALQAMGGAELESVGLDQEGIASDMAALVGYFNDRFELYGRTVRFQVYEGQGDILQEYLGRNQQGAQADAARAKDAGAFADVSYAGQSQLYAEAASSMGIVVFSPIYLTREWHEARAPFSHSAYWPSTEEGAQFQVNVVCGALHPGKADRSSSAATRAQDRAFGIIHPENPEYARIGELLHAGLDACGAPVARRVAYALDVTTGAQQATNAMAQMRAAGATTILCACDFLFPQLMMVAAQRQGYVPEWFLTFHWSDPFYRTYPPEQFNGQLVGGGVTTPFLDTEPGKVFRAATGGGTPESPYTFDKVYQQILMLFSGLQAAGPNLTPETMFRGLEQLPSTLDGAVGPWEFGPGPAMPRRWSALGVYDPNATNPIDGRRGSSIGCFGGRYFRFDDTAAFDGPLDCPL